jgi:hypothetical protein
MKSTATKLSRRTFLLAAGAGTAATGLALVAKNTAPAKTSDADKAGQGYQLTEHVRKYYRSTKV